ncbi:hypothetical protein AK965_07415 [Vibrio sp. PID17_43]|nr:hypothetical protein AK965_07415 [Vibrio sp. PID17_43]
MQRPLTNIFHSKKKLQTTDLKPKNNKKTSEERFNNKKHIDYGIYITIIRAVYPEFGFDNSFYFSLRR